MLVLSRRIGERIVIGDNVTVTVIDIRGNNVVRLGIDAPLTTKIMREELILEKSEPKV